MTAIRKTTAIYCIILLIVSALNYVPGLADDEGRTFGIFALDIYDDALHFASAVWAGAAAVMSHRASKIFLLAFGALYLADGLLGLATGSGFLDLGIVNYGILDLPFGFKVLANTPHIGLGAVALACGLFLDRAWSTVRPA